MLPSQPHSFLCSFLDFFDSILNILYNHRLHAPLSEEFIKWETERTALTRNIARCMHNNQMPTCQCHTYVSFFFVLCILATTNQIEDSILEYLLFWQVSWCICHIINFINCLKCNAFLFLVTDRIHLMTADLNLNGIINTGWIHNTSLGKGIMAQRAAPLLGTLPSHLGGWARVLATLPPIQRRQELPGRQQWWLMWDAYVAYWARGFGITQPWLLWAFGEWLMEWKTLLSFK